MSSENNITLLSSSSACKEISRIIFIGSGTSMGTPVLGCLMKFPMDCEVKPIRRRLELFIVDGMPNGHNISSHWNMEDALKEVRQWRPKETRFTGVSHLMLYEPTNLTLRKLWHEEQLNVQLAYDGLCIDVHL